MGSDLQRRTADCFDRMPWTSDPDYARPVASTPLETDVLIFGAGPTGLMLATVLAKLGVRHILIDGKSGPTTESRALGIQACTMEIYEQLGLDVCSRRSHGQRRLPRVWRAQVRSEVSAVVSRVPLMEDLR